MRITLFGGAAQAAVLLLAACGLGLPSSLGFSGTPGLHVPLGYVFSAAGGDNGMLAEYFDRATIKKHIDKPDARVWNYEYGDIVVDKDGTTVNGVMDAQTYLISYPVATLDGLVPGVTIPDISFDGPGFEDMLGTLRGIKFRYVWCYILVTGIYGSGAKIALNLKVPDDFEDDAYTPQDYTTIDGARYLQLLPNDNLVCSMFDVPDGDDAPYTRPVTGASAPGFSLAPVFRHEPGASKMRITITNAALSGDSIDVSMLLVLPLVFAVPPERDAAGNPLYIEIDNTKYARMDVAQLDNLDVDLSAFGNTVSAARFHVDGIKNDVFSDLYLAISTGLNAAGGYEWSETLVSLREAARNPPVDITGISRIPKMALLTKAGVPSGSEYIGVIALKPSAGNKTNEFDFMITLDAVTDFSQSVRFK